jgi:RNA polymerase sigma-54 factor
MLNQKLQQKLLQKLSPQQIQLIKLLELPTLQLEQRIKKELDENPILEEGGEHDEPDINQENEESDSNEDEFSLEDYIDDDEVPNYKLQENNHSKDEKRPDIPFAVAGTFHESLLEQLMLRNLNEEEKFLGKFIIGTLDEDGYLRRDLEDIVDDLAFTQNIQTNVEALLKVLELVQDLDPPGIGARDLRECLLLQLKSKDLTDPAVESAYHILRDHFEEFSRKHFDKILKRLDLDEDELKDAMDEILRLNPKPGGMYADSVARTTMAIIPDFMLDYDEGEFRLSLNQRNVPELRISREYSSMIQTLSSTKIKTRADKETILYVKQKIDSARWFIEAIQQRQHTLLSTMQEIINFQKDYFTEGDETKLKPMILKDIADRTGLDISTVSRVANSKYIQTHFGILSLKFFFSEGMMTDGGEEVSTREIKKILQDCLAVEDKRKPLTDDKLADILNEKGYQIARRTVAKYREQLDIPVARMRKEL